MFVAVSPLFHMVLRYSGNSAFGLCCI